MTLLELKGVTLGYDSRPAVEEATFDVKEGDFFCVVGSNGSGKSTLLKGLLGLIPPLGGKISRALKPEETAYVPQTESAERGFPATVREIVLTGTQKKGRRIPFYAKDDRSAAEHAMALFEITTLANRQIGELSGGQQKRVMLARAMCRRPSLLLLDEPCSGLDTETRGAFYATLRRLNSEEGVTVVMVSHDLEDVERSAHRVIVLARRVVFLGDVKSWKTRCLANETAARAL